jgi:hypothetical protein
MTCRGCYQENIQENDPTHYHLDELEELWQKSNHNKRRSLRLALLMKHPYCYYCKAWVHINSSTIDHKAPKSKFPPKTRLPKVLACDACNQDKAAMWASEFKREYAEVLEQRRLSSTAPIDMTETKVAYN